MNVIGIVAEYNPFHLGHLYQINKIKDLYPNSIIIVVMSTCFTQRGEISILDKWDKTKIALDNGVDLVLELPFVFASQSADIFAKGSLQILNRIGIDTLVFGSETADTNYLNKMADIQLNHSNYNDKVKYYLDKGNNYPTSLSLALKDILGYTVNSPNDLLALSYIKEIKKNNYNINPVAIKRTNNYHSNIIDSNIINASLIRKLFLDNKDITKYISNYNLNNLIKIQQDDFFDYLKYQIINNKDNLDKFQTVDEGIENRIIDNINKVTSWQEMVDVIKTKRYTYNKVNRMLIHILTGLKKEQVKNINIDYLRILGFSKIGQKYLNKMKKNIDIPLCTHYKKGISEILDIELKITNIYDLKAKRDLVKKEYSQKPIIRD